MTARFRPAVALLLALLQLVPIAHVLSESCDAVARSCCAGAHDGGSADATAACCESEQHPAVGLEKSRCGCRVAPTPSVPGAPSEALAEVRAWGADAELDEIVASLNPALPTVHVATVIPALAEPGRPPASVAFCVLLL